MKYLCFRFDVDTHKCIREGVPNLLELSNYFNVKFTFFVNVGKSVDRLHFFQSKIKDSGKIAITLSPFTKLGLKDYLYLSLFNPSISKYTKEIKMIYENNHEVGLHGGRNHQDWSNNAKFWSQDKIKHELLWALRILNKIDKKPINGFASPGWNGSSKINTMLHELGFLYVSDRHSNKPYEKITQIGGLKEIPTNISGEPGGVGYLEYCRASKMNDIQVLADFREKLNERQKLAVVYDHPYYSGTKELPLIREMIKMAKSMNISIVTMQEVLNKL